MSGVEFAIWDRDACARVHETSLRVLAETGIDVCHDGALGLLSKAGAKVDGVRARFPRTLIEEALASAPREFALRSRGGHPDFVMDAQHSYYGTGSDCLYVLDPDTGVRRRALVADIEGMAAVSELLPNIEFIMSMGLPDDVPQAIDDLSQFAAMLRGSRKQILFSARDGRILAAMQEMAAACGEAQSFGIYAMPAPPLSLEAEAVDKLITCGQLGIPVIFASAPAAGATAPMSRAGVAVIGNAEILSGLVINQLAAPGAPFVCGVSQGALNLRTSLELYAAPEAFAVMHAGCDLARFYGLPSFTAAGASDAKVLDGQWAAETAATLAYGALSRATLIHDLGFFESGLQSSYESIVFADEFVNFARSYTAGVAITDESLALAEIQEVGPGGSYLARKYTRQHRRDYWQPGLLDQWSYGVWESHGGVTLNERLQARVQELRATPQPFELDGDAEKVLERTLVKAIASR